MAEESPALEATEHEAEDYGEAPAADPGGLPGGWWLTAKPKDVHRAIVKRWEGFEPMRKRLRAQWRANELWREGVRGVRVVADDEEDVFEVRLPLSGSSQTPGPNLADRNIRRIGDTLFQDPPKPQCEPTSDTPEERQASELVERILTVEGSAQHRDDEAIGRATFDIAATYGSGFKWVRTDPTGGGLRPLAIQATPSATSTADAVFVLDPQTGQQREAQPDEMITRYVLPMPPDAEDGTPAGLTDNPLEAQHVWAPDVIETYVRPQQVVLLPLTGPSMVDDARGVIIAEVDTLAAVVARYYNGVRPKRSVIEKLVRKEWIDDWAELIPPAQRPLAETEVPKRPPMDSAEGGQDERSDDELCLLLHLYLLPHPVEAPQGAHICIASGDHIVKRDGFALRGPRGIEERPLPLAQLRTDQTHATGHPFGKALIERLGPMDEINAMAFGAILEHFDQYAHPWLLLPFGTSIQPGDVEARRPVYYNAEKGGPVFAPTPALTSIVSDLFDRTEAEINSESGLEDTARGLDTGNVTSGKQADTLVQQALIALGGANRGVNAFFLRLWTLRAIEFRATIDTPRTLDYTGPGGSAQQMSWQGSDLDGASDITIARGTGRMMTAAQKAAVAREELAAAAQVGDQMAVQRYYRQVAGNTGMQLGLRDDPFRARIDRQCALWREAVRQTWPEPPQPEPPMVGIDAFGNEVEMPSPVPPDPVLDEIATVFTPNPTDVLPFVAPVRMLALAEEIASPAFTAADPRWQQAITMEFQRMQQAAQPPMPAPDPNAPPA